MTPLRKRPGAGSRSAGEAPGAAETSRSPETPEIRDSSGTRAASEIGELSGTRELSGIRQAVAADAEALAEIAGAALTHDAGEAASLVARLAAPPAHRSWTALVTRGLDGVVFASMSARDPWAGHLDLLAVRPEARGAGLGRALVTAAEDWLRGRGATEARFAGNPPCYAWPGIDVRYTAAACLAESLGYERHNVAWNMTADLTGDLSVDADLGRLAALGVTVHAVAPGDRAAVSAFVEEQWNANWAWEAEQATGCHYAVRDGEILGFAAWGARPSWFGPMGTAPAARGLGVGRVLVRRCLAEQRAAGMSSAQIGWVGPLRFYARTVGAHAERVFWLYRRGLS
ncbi:GNAT family N-acetyltransferase [Streptosporangium sp. NPDC000509]|uniref:GNAT family N-acetyltransferase n=1 Tax=Streptosporangium sp. NPDC000509 TaxID=3366186 RepID=UPI003689F495